jgi:hypothetical protein
MPKEPRMQKHVEMGIQYIVFKQDKVQYKKLYKIRIHCK